MKKPKQPPIGFGRAPMPEEAGQDPEQEKQQPEEKPLEPPLAMPIFIDDVTLNELFARYSIFPLAPLSKFEYQLVCLVAGLEQRIRELQ